MNHAHGDGSEPIARASGAHAEERRVAHSGRLGAGTLACGRCDAPVAIGVGPLSLIDTLTCPFCENCAPVRDFLSLASPTRPAHVVVRVTQPSRSV
jgi:hypothetical protein